MANSYIKYPIIGGFTLISSADADIIKGYDWFVDRDGYATAFTYNGKVSSIRMHNLIKQRTEDHPCIDHTNRVRLDNRQDNLKAVTWQEQYKNKGEQIKGVDTPYTDSELRIPKIHKTPPVSVGYKRLILKQEVV